MAFGECYCGYSFVMNLVFLEQILLTLALYDLGGVAPGLPLIPLL